MRSVHVCLADADVKSKAEKFLFCSPNDTETLSRVITQDELLNVSHLIVKVTNLTPYTFSHNIVLRLQCSVLNVFYNCFSFRHTRRQRRSCVAGAAKANARTTETCQLTVVTCHHLTPHKIRLTSRLLRICLADRAAALPLRTADFRLLTDRSLRKERDERRRV